jgi:hypothetical protein
VSVMVVRGMAFFLSWLMFAWFRHWLSRSLMEVAIKAGRQAFGRFRYCV